MFNWGSADYGMTAEHQGSKPVVHVTVLDFEGESKSFVLPHEQVKGAVKDLLKAMVQNGSAWAGEVLAEAERHTME